MKFRQMFIKVRAKNVNVFHSTFYLDVENDHKGIELIVRNALVGMFVLEGYL